MDYLISKFFDEETLERIKIHLLNSKWEDGLESYTPHPWCDGHAVKKNLQTRLSDNSILYEGMDKNEEFLDFTFAKSTNDPMVTRTETGGYYRCHYDFWKNGHFSTTIFLNDPSTYEGGELCLFKKGKEERLKLQAGWGVTYDTGTSHMVSDVTSGTRDAIVYWTKSWIPDLEDLQKCRYYTMMYKRHEHDTPCSVDDLTTFDADLTTHFREKAYKIRRKYI
jgi:PKHD-type hydroxylase